MPPSVITPNLARAFGLVANTPHHEALARALLNPESKCVERFIYSRGLCAVYVGRWYLNSVGEAGKGRAYLRDMAEQCPELPHLTQWADTLESK